MKEKYNFNNFQLEIKRKKSRDEFSVITKKQEKTISSPMELRDYWLNLRYSIQEKIPPAKTTPEENKNIKQLNEIITPELKNGYKQILEIFREKTQKTKQHPQRELINIDEEEIDEKIKEWINNLIAEIKEKNINFNKNDIEELEMQCWLFFDSLSNVINTRSFEKDVTDFYKEKNINNLEDKEKTKQKEKLIKTLQARYSLNKTEASLLINLIQSSDENKYSPKELIKIIKRLWQEYELGNKKKDIAKISLGYLTAKGAESFAPYLFKNIISDSKFNVAVFLEFFGLNKISEIINTKINIELEKIIYDLNCQINERITNSLFFQEFEFIHDKSLGEIYEILEQGKGAIKELLSNLISQFAPTLSGIAMSLGFLAKINPALGGIGLAGLPVMYKIAKKQNEQIQPIYEKERTKQEKIMTHLNSIKNGFENIKTSPDTPTIANHVKEQMNVKDYLSLQRIIKETKNRLKRMIPFDVSTVIAASVGGALQAEGIISGGAVLSNIIYSDRLNRPIQNLVNLYFNRFSRYIQDIQRMDKILGKYEKLDLPNGKEEKNRLPISKLKNYNISIEDLQYKNILNKINLKINQGEFVAITGASGIGKTTLLRNIVGLYKPDAGEVKIGGISNDNIKKYGPESIYSLMSYCNQNPCFFEEMTLRENLLLWSKEQTDDEKIKQILKILHLEKFTDKLDKKVKHLSGGEKVRIGIARAFIKKAKIILLDEPTANLDSQAATEIYKAISELNENYPDTTIIVVTHDEKLMQVSKRLINLDPPLDRKKPSCKIKTAG